LNPRFKTLATARTVNNNRYLYGLLLAAQLPVFTVKLTVKNCKTIMITSVHYTKLTVIFTAPEDFTPRTLSVATRTLGAFTAKIIEYWCGLYDYGFSPLVLRLRFFVW
jgi:hypothetical protein